MGRLQLEPIGFVRLLAQYQLLRPLAHPDYRAYRHLGITDGDICDCIFYARRLGERALDRTEQAYVSGAPRDVPDLLQCQHRRFPDVQLRGPRG